MKVDVSIAQIGPLLVRPEEFNLNLTSRPDYSTAWTTVYKVYGTIATRRFQRMPAL